MASKEIVKRNTEYWNKFVSEFKKQFDCKQINDFSLFVFMKRNFSDVLTKKKNFKILFSDFYNEQISNLDLEYEKYLIMFQKTPNDLCLKAEIDIISQKTNDMIKERDYVIEKCSMEKIKTIFDIVDQFFIQEQQFLEDFFNNIDDFIQDKKPLNVNPRSKFFL